MTVRDSDEQSGACPSHDVACARNSEKCSVMSGGEQVDFYGFKVCTVSRSSGEVCVFWAEAVTRVISSVQG